MVQATPQGLRSGYKRHRLSWCRHNHSHRKKLCQGSYHRCRSMDNSMPRNSHRLRLHIRCPHSVRSRHLRHDHTHLLSHHVEENSRGILLYMEVDKECGVQAIYRFVQDNNFHISTIEKQKRQALQGKDAVISAKLDLHKRQSHEKIINQLYQIDAIHYIEEIK